ncbi:MAG TPA: DUF4340 domain-containing protein [Gemmata sp.]
MNWKSTIPLVLLAVCAGVWLWKSDEIAPNFGRRPAVSDSPALAALERDLTPDTVTRIEVRPVGGEPFVLEKGSAGWTQPGNWPLRTTEVNELVAALTTAHTRFRPLALPTDPDLTTYGLAADQKPLVVKVTANGADYTLTFGEPKPAGDTAFTRPAYVRVNDAAEVLQLGPDVMPVLRRPAESYRRRQLFSSVERVKVAGGPALGPPGAPPEESPPVTVSLPGEAIEEIRVSSKSVSALGFTPWFWDGRFTLKRVGPTPEPSAPTKGAEPVVQPERLAGAWEVAAPVRDRVDPSKLQKLLTAVPELWVEDFVPTAQGALPEQPFALAQLFPVPGQPFIASVARLHPETVPDPRAELKKSKESVGVRLKGGGTVTVKFGGTAKVVEREEQITVPNPMGGPPRTFPQKVPTKYRYAQIEGNPQLFTVNGDRLNGLFVTAGDLVDPAVARFARDEVQAVTVAVPGKPPITLTRKKGSAKATKDEDKQDRWLVAQQPNPLLADAARVEDLIAKLAGFRGNVETDLYKADPQKSGLDPATAITVTVTARAPRPEGEPEAPARVYTLHIGAPDFAKGQFPVQLAGWPRIARIEDRVAGAPEATGWLAPKLFPERLSALFARPAVAYRGRKLLDTADAKLVSITVAGENGFALKKENVSPSGAWKLSTPIVSDTDPARVANLLDQLTGLQATEFVAEKGANPAEYGFDKPKLTVQFRFDDERNYKLEVGAARPGKKDEVFARLDGGAVFGLPTATTDALAAGPVGLLPLQVWSVPPDQVTAAEITRLDVPADSFALAKDGTNWKLSGPFAAPVPFLNAQPMLTGLGALHATKYEALAAPDQAKYGFDKPLAKVKLAYTEKAGGTEQAVTKTVVIGGVTPAGADRYAKLDEPSAPVFVVPEAYLAAVRTEPLSLPDQLLLFLNSPQITKVQVAGDKPDSAITLTKGTNGAWQAEGVAFAIDEVAAGQLARVFAPLPVQKLAAYGDAIKWADYGLDKPEVTFTIALGGEKPETHTVQLGKAAPGGGRFVRVDGGKAVGVVPANAVPVLTRTKLEFADRTLFRFDPAALTELTRVKGKEELTLVPGPSVGWDIVKPAKQKADPLLVDELAETLAKLRADKIVAFGKKDDVFKQYGLEPAEASVTLTVGEKAEQKVLRIGRPVDPAKPTGERYAAVDGTAPDAAVGVLPGALANKLLAPPVSFRDRTLAKFVDADKLQLERGDRKITFEKVSGTWKVTAPLMAAAEQSALDDFVNELAKLRAADWVAEKPADLKPFGLDKPEATWTVSNGDKVVLTLQIGKAAPDGRVYASAGPDGMVALLGNNQAAKVLAEYRARKPWTVDAFQAERIEITRGGKTFALQKQGAAWADPGAPTDLISAPAVTELLGSLTALQVERYAVDENGDPKLFGLEKPEVVLAVTFKDGTTRELAIGGPVGGTNEKQRYARVLDKGRSDVFVLSTADTARLTRDRSAYVQKK